MKFIRYFCWIITVRHHGKSKVIGLLGHCLKGKQDTMCSVLDPNVCERKALVTYFTFGDLAERKMGEQAKRGGKCGALSKGALGSSLITFLGNQKYN